MLRPVALALAVALGGLACSDDDAGPRDAGPVDAGPPPVWTQEPGVPTTEDLLAVWGRSADEVYAVGWNGTILRYDGIAWRPETTTSTTVLTAVHGRPVPEDALPEDPPPPTFAVGWGGVVLERVADGWQPATVTTTASEDLFGLWVGADDSGLAVGDRGRVLGWDGMAWNEVAFSVPGEFSGEPIEPKGVLKGVWSSNGGRYYMTGSGGASYRSANGYERFEALDTRVSDPLRAVWGTANNNVYTVGLDTLILRFSGRWRRLQDDGADVLPRNFLFGVWGRDADDVTAVGWGGLAVRWTEGVWAHEVTGVETDLRSVWVDAETGLAFAVGASGTIMRREPPPAPPPEEAGP